jgi:hypothetical protein
MWHSQPAEHVDVSSFPIASLCMPRVSQEESADSSLGEGAVMACPDETEGTGGFVRKEFVDGLCR